MAAKIHYDVTDILEHALHSATLSGMQRVCTRLLTHLVNTHGTERLGAIAWHPIQRRMIAIDAAYFGGDYRYDQGDLVRRFGLDTAQTSARPVDPAGASGEARLAQADIVVVIGNTLSFHDYIAHLGDARREPGITVVHFIHDLVPLFAPEHVIEGVPDQFQRWLAHVGRNADYLLTNSQATRRDLAGWLADNGIDLPSGVLPLAHQFGDSARPRPGQVEEAGAEPIGDLVRDAAHLPYALCVGTMESRKNISMLAKVWQRLQARLGPATPRLLFAGRHGWLTEDFDAFIRDTRSLSGAIRIVERPSDAELAYLYRRCLFSVYPSFKEGWGLPIGEGLWLGRPVVCSNTSSMPEVGGPWADYVDPTSSDSIEAGLLRMITDVDYRERRAAGIAAAPLRAWADVADDLWRELASGEAVTRRVQ